MMVLRFAGVAALLLVFIALNARYPEAPFMRDIPLVLLVVSSGTLSAGALIPLSLVAVFGMNWQPVFSLEMALIVLLPLLAHVARRVMAFRSAVGSVILTLAGVFVFYAATSARAAAAAWSAAAGFAAVNAVAAFLLSLLLNLIYHA